MQPIDKLENIVVYSKSTCPYCNRAIRFLNEKIQKFNFSAEDDNLEKFTIIDIGLFPERRAEMIEKSNGRTTVPQIFINQQHIGGCDDLLLLEKSGQLDEFFKSSI